MFVRAANPIWFFNNLTGQVLDDTYWAFFLTNTLPYLPQAVYQDPNGTTPWSDPIEFQPSGGLPNNLYFDPALVYRIEIRKGPTQVDPLIWLVENFVPNGGGSSTNTTFSNSENLITNPQFAYVNFTSPHTITTAGTYNIAPGWQLVLTGVGTSTVLNQVNLPGQDDIHDAITGASGGNPPFELVIDNNGWTSAALVQTFNFNGALFAGGSVAMSILAMPETSAQAITLNYKTSTPFTQNPPIASKTLTAGVYSILSGVGNIDSSTNGNLGDAAFTQMEIVLRPTGKIHITNVQFIGQSVQVVNPASVTAPLFQEESIERETDHLFHYYAGSLVRESKDTLLVGWDFALNPFQFWAKTPAGAVPINQYTLDQTIIIQQKYVTSATGNNVLVGQATTDLGQGMLIDGNTATSQFAIIQYLEPEKLVRYWGTVLSSMVRILLTTAVASQVKLKMRLAYTDSTPTLTTQTYPIASWAAGTTLAPTDPVFDPSFTVIIPQNDPEYLLQTSVQNFPFDSFTLPTIPPATARFLAVVLYTSNSMAAGDSIVINDVSLVPNDFALPSNAKTPSQVLAECQYYYEKSYDVETQVSSVSTNGAVSGMMAAVGSEEISPLNAIFKVSKYKVPSSTQFRWYSPATGAIDTIRDNTVGADVTVTTTTNIGKNGASWPKTAAPIPDEHSMTVQWLADVRIGM